MHEVPFPEPQPTPEQPPRSSAEILARAGISPEQLQGKNVLYFGPEGETVEGTNTFDEEYYLETDEISTTGNPLDFILSQGDKTDYLTGNLSQEERLEFLGVSVGTLSPGGELRIVNPDVDTTRPNIALDFERALENKGVENTSAIYETQTDNHDTYISIRRTS